MMGRQRPDQDKLFCALRVGVIHFLLKRSNKFTH